MVRTLSSREAPSCLPVQRGVSQQKVDQGDCRALHVAPAPCLSLSCGCTSPGLGVLPPQAAGPLAGPPLGRCQLSGAVQAPCPRELPGGGTPLNAPVPCPLATPLGQTLSGMTVGAAGELGDPFAAGGREQEGTGSCNGNPGCRLPAATGRTQRAPQGAERVSSGVREWWARAEGPARPRTEAAEGGSPRALQSGSVFRAGLQGMAQATLGGAGDRAGPPAGVGSGEARPLGRGPGARTTRLRGGTGKQRRGSSRLGAFAWAFPPASLRGPPCSPVRASGVPVGLTGGGGEAPTGPGRRAHSPDTLLFGRGGQSGLGSRSSGGREWGLAGPAAPRLVAGVSSSSGPQAPGPGGGRVGSRGQRGPLEPGWGCGLQLVARTTGQAGRGPP